MDIYNWTLPADAVLAIAECNVIAQQANKRESEEWEAIGVKRPSYISGAVVQIVFDSIVEMLKTQGRITIVA